MFGMGRNDEQRQLKQMRKKRGTRKYGQNGMKYSGRGILSCLSGAGALLLLLGCILYAFLSRGEAAGIIGGIAIVALILSICGIRWAIRGFRERERNYLTCKIGLPLNAVSLILFLVIFIGGLS